MLVLCRRRNEKLLIGEEIEVKVLEIKGRRVRLGIVAPDGVAIRRPETQGDAHDGARERAA